MNRFNDEKVQEIREYPFMEKIDELMLPAGRKQYLRWGKHSTPPPFVNIIIPTYKRATWLKETINSILNSEDFDDYQIIIMDNEGITENPEITETERMIYDLKNPKIVYYREEINTPFNWNHLIHYAQAEWLCMVHDDDLLDIRHLKIMSRIVLENPQIQFCGCQLQKFSDIVDIQKNHSTENHVKVQYYPYTDFIYSFAVPFLGAFFKRENAVELGGTDTKILSGIGDYIFVAKYAYYFNSYRCELPLYNYRISNKQLTANDDGEYNSRISDYYLMLSIAGKTSIFVRYLFLKNCKYIWCKRLRQWLVEETYGDRKDQLYELLERCKIDKRVYQKTEKKNLVNAAYWCARKSMFKIFHKPLFLKID